MQPLNSVLKALETKAITADKQKDYRTALTWLDLALATKAKIRSIESETHKKLQLGYSSR